MLLIQLCRTRILLSKTDVFPLLRSASISIFSFSFSASNRSYSASYLAAVASTKAFLRAALDEVDARDKRVDRVRECFLEFCEIESIFSLISGSIGLSVSFPWGDFTLLSAMSRIYQRIFTNTNLGGGARCAVV